MPTYYDTHARSYAAATLTADLTAQYSHFLPRLKPGDKILDVGSGSGRDAAAFASAGFRVTALEPSANLCEEIKNIFSGEIINSDILSYNPDEPCDAIWACASLLHLQENALLQFFHEIGRYVKPGGVIYVSGKSGIETGEDEKGRYFLNFSEELISEILKQTPSLTLEELWYSEDVVGRRDVRWMNFILHYAG